MAVVKNLMVRAGADFSAITKQSQKARASMDTMQRGVDKSCSKMGKAAAGMTKVFGALGVALSAAAVTSFAKNAMSAYADVVSGEARLAQVMRNTMGAVGGQVDAIKELIAEQERLGVVDGDVQTAGAQELATYLGLTSSLEQLIPVMGDMIAQQYGFAAGAESAVSIATMMGKVMEGQTSALSRYGYSFTEAQERVLKFGEESERAAVLADVISQSVGGMNQALAQTDVGRQKQLAFVFGDIQDKFGAAFTQLSILLLPALHALAAVLARVAAFAQSVAQAMANLFGGTTSQVVATTDAIGGAADGVEALADGTVAAGKAAKGATAGFDKLNVLGAGAAGGGEADSGADIALGGLGGAIVTTETQFDGMADRITGFFAALEAAVQPVAQTLVGMWDSLRPAVVTATTQIWAAVSGLLPLMQQMWRDITELGSPLATWFSGDFVAYLQTVVETIGIVVSGLVDTFGTVFGDIWTIVIAPAVSQWAADILPMFTQFAAELLTTFGSVFAEVKQTFDLLWSDAVAPGLEAVMAIWTDTWRTISAFWSKWGAPIFAAVRTAMQQMGNVFRTVWTSTLKPVWDSFMQTVDWLWSEHLQPLLANFLDFVGELVTGALAIYSGVIAPLVMWLSEILGPVIASVFSGAIAVIGSFLVGVTDVINGIVSVLRGLVMFISGVFTGDWAKAWEGVKAVFEGVWNALVGIVKVPINLIIDAINFLARGIGNALSGLINIVITGINILIKGVLAPINLMIDALNAIPGVNIGRVSLALPAVPSFGNAIPQIPKLAAGAVIPPNEEFLAVLGDQTSGRNLEGPEDLFRAIVREEFARQSQSGARVPELVLRVDGSIADIARKLRPHIEYEGRRVGVKLVTGGV